MKSATRRSPIFGGWKPGRTTPPLDAVALRTTDGYELSDQLVALLPGAPAGAAFAAAAGELLIHHLSAGRRGVAICAASNGVGATLIAANLAIALSKAGASILLVDGNLNTPTVEDLIRPPTSGPGLSDLLSTDALTLSDIVHVDVLPWLSVAYAGSADAATARISDADRFFEFTESCLRDFDCTIFSTPGSNRSTDARTIAVAIGYSLIVARRGFSYAKDVTLLKDQLRQDGVSIVGSILSAG